MRGVNKAILIGNLGADPEMRYFTDGTAVCNFRMATSEAWTDRQTGEKREKTEWHRVVAFRRLAEICGQYLKKGSKVYVEGKLQTRTYEKDGQTHYTTEIVANELQMLDSRGQQQSGPVPPSPYGGGGGGGGGFQGASQPGQTYNEGGDFSSMPPDDDIPF